MTGGSVAFNASSTEAVTLCGRVASGATKVAPANNVKWTVASGGTGVYNITFGESYAEFLGAQLTLEAASGIVRMDSFTASTKVMVVKTFAVDGTTATAKAFAFLAVFSENKTP